MRTHDEHAYRSHARKKAAQKFNEVVRRNTRGWDEPAMSDDERAIAEDAIVRAAREFHDSTHNDYDWPER